MINYFNKSITENIVANFLSKSTLPLDIIYFYEPESVSELSNSYSVFFILPNKMVHECTVRAGIKKNYLYSENSFLLDKYNYTALSKHLLDKIANAIQNPKKFELSFFNSYHLLPEFEEMINNQYNLITIHQEKERLSNIISEKSGSNNNKI